MDVVMDSETNLVMHSMTDLGPYSLPPEIFIGKLKTPGTDYVRLDKIGQGPNSIVYKTKMKGSDENDKFYAQKLLKNIQQSNGELAKEVYREITLLNSLDHENVIKLREILMGEVPTSLNLIFDYCDMDLEYFIQNYPLPEIKHDQVKCIAIHLFRGLNYLHKSYIVHRDIKPSNLLVCLGGSLKIADFGIARRWSHHNRPKTPGMMTARYQAPELVFEAPDYDSKVDMWSAGCVVIEIMTRKPFFNECDNQIRLMNRIIEILGVPRADNWPRFNRCRVPRQIRLSGQPYNKIVDTLNGLKCTVANDLLENLIKYDSEKRYTAEKCLSIDWFEQAPYPAKCIEKPMVPVYLQSGLAQAANYYSVSSLR